MKRLILFLCCLSTLLVAQEYEKHTFESSEGLQLPYRILFPENYESGQSYPLLVFLHGYGERGTDNEAQLAHGSSLFLNHENRAQFPAIVVFPQCPAGDMRWSWYERGDGDEAWRVPLYEKPQTALQAVIELVGKIMVEEKVDADRLYAMGLSMGGFGTFELIARMPGRFAAAVPICGGGNTAAIGLYGHDTKLWIFHGGADNVVPVANSRKMYEAIKQWDSEVKYTEYPGVNHESWTPTFAEPTLLPWLFAQQKKGN